MYFTMVHEQAILDYVKSEDKDEKERLYISLLEPAFTEMIDKIVYTFKFNSLPNIDVLKHDCLLQVVNVLCKYDKDRGSKAFAYFSVIVKNWFIQQTKKNKKRMIIEQDSDDKIREAYHSQLIVHNPYHKTREQQEFIDGLGKQIVNWKEMPNLGVNELKVIHAIEHLFANINEIEFFSKKAIYLYLRELTGLTTKEIVAELTKLRKSYKVFKKGWERSAV
jgi:hypothetical protein